MPDVFTDACMAEGGGAQKKGLVIHHTTSVYKFSQLRGAKSPLAKDVSL